MKIHNMKLFLFAAMILSLVSCGSGSSSVTPDPTPEWNVKDVETYAYAPSVPKSRKYLVAVNGVRQLTYPSKECDICTFGCSGKVQVTIYAMNSVSSAVALPFSKGYSISKGEDGASFTMEVEPYDRVIVEFDGSEKDRLYIFANPRSDVEGERPDKNDPNVLYFEAGKEYPDNHIQIKSNQTMYIEGGCVLNAKIYAQNAQNVKLHGYGIIDAFDNKAEVNGVRFQDCSGVELKGIVLLNNNGRSVFAAQSDHILYDNVKAIGEIEGEQNDTFDLYCDHDVTVKRCFAIGNDDTYCIKSQKFIYKGESYNIHFEDCIARNTRGNSFEIGYETGYPIHDISYKNIYSVHSSGGSGGIYNVYRRGAVTIHAAAGGTVSNINYENVYIEDPLEYTFSFLILKSEYSIGEDEHGNPIPWSPGKIENVTLKNVYVAHDGPEHSQFWGYDTGHAISNLTFENLYYGDKKIATPGEAQFSLKYADVKIK